MNGGKTMRKPGPCLGGLLLTTVLAALPSASVAVGQDSADTARVTTPPQGKMPILVVTDSRCETNPFGSYLWEILRSEGLVEFDRAERPALSAEDDPNLRLSAYGVVLLAEMDLSATEERLLREYVSGGGVLIAMRPDADLADLFGIRIVGTRPEQLLQYFAVDVDNPTGSGIVEEPLQYHGQASNYSPDGAAPLAHFHDDGNLPSSHPAATVNRYGKGHAVAFAFDLAKSVVLLRQGNPEWQDSEGDGLPGYRPMDLFIRTDGRTYFDPGRFRIPQADEQQRFLANIIMRLAEKPLPRMWYLPGMHKVMVVNTGDAESNYQEQLDPAFEDCAGYGGFFTAYLRNGPNNGIEMTTVPKEAAWRAGGHEIGVHMFGGGPDGAGASATLREAYRAIVSDLKAKFGHGSRTARNHTLDWTGWVDMAATEAEFGTGMDMNYYHYVTFDTPLTSSGYFNGSGLPQRLIDMQGKILPIYQAATQWPDEWFADKGMTAEQTVEIITRMLEAGRDGFYSAFVANIHQCRYNGSYGNDRITPVWPHALWAYCRDEGIPSWSAEMLLSFVEARNATRFENITWRTDSEPDRRELAFDFRTPVGGQDLTIMIPRRWSGQVLDSVAADGKTMALANEAVKGIEYGMFTTKERRTHFVARYASLDR